MKTLKKLTLFLVALFALALGPIGLAHAQVKVTSADPASAIQGTVSLDVTVNGSGFDSTAKAKFFVTGTSETGGITVRKTVVKGTKQIIATIDVADAAVVNKFDIEVTLSSGRKGKGTTLFTVLKKAVAGLDPCVGAETRGFPALVFGRQMTVSGVNAWYFVAADATGTCERTIVNAGSASHDHNFRYDPSTGRGVLLGSANAYGHLAATIDVTFDSQGAPAVQTSAFSTIMVKADVPILPELQGAGWTLQYMSPAAISPDGSRIVFSGWYIHPTLGDLNVNWVCPFSFSAATLDSANCRDVFRRAPDSGSTQASWGARGDSLYFTVGAQSGFGTALYRLMLSDGMFSQIWSRGTDIMGAKAALDPFGHERVVVYEWDPTPAHCVRLLVIDADTCVDNNCQILNGGGNPGRSLTWLPDGRVAAEGQTVPNRKGQCSAAGSIVTFDSNDTTGTSTTLISIGTQPDGSGGG
jgi:hypothetical protein